MNVVVMESTWKKSRWQVGSRKVQTEKAERMAGEMMWPAISGKQFIEALERRGCRIEEHEHGIMVYFPSGDRRNFPFFRNEIIPPKKALAFGAVAGLSPEDFRRNK